jgi:positive regulator of sigma E activity
MANRPLIAGETERGRLSAILVWPDSVVLVGAPVAKVQSAIQKGARTVDDFKQAGLGSWAILRGCPTSSIKRMTVHEGSGHIKIWFDKGNGKTDSIESYAKSTDLRQKITQTLSRSLSSNGLKKTSKNASPISQAILPLAGLGLAVLIGGTLTVLQASGNENPDLDSDFSGGRSARRAKGLRLILTSLADVLGFTGCLIATLVAIGIALLFLFLRLKNRPTVLTFE